MKKQPLIGVKLKVYIERKKEMDEVWIDQLVGILEKEHDMVFYAKILAEEVVLVVNLDQSGMEKERVVGPERGVVEGNFSEVIRAVPSF